MNLNTLFTVKYKTVNFEVTIQNSTFLHAAVPTQYFYARASVSQIRI